MAVNVEQSDWWRVQFYAPGNLCVRLDVSVAIQSPVLLIFVFLLGNNNVCFKTHSVSNQ